MTDKISKRDMYSALIAWANGEDFKYDMDDLTAFAQNEIDLLDRKAEKTRERAAKKREAGDELRDTVESLLTDEFQTIPELLAQIEGDDLTPNKIAVRASALEKMGRAVKEVITVEDSEGHKVKKTAYKLA